MPDATSGAATPLSANKPVDGYLRPGSQLRWRRSSRCGTSGACVEVADLDGGVVALRDGKIGDASPVLVFEPAEWAAFVAGVKRHEFG